MRKGLQILVIAIALIFSSGCATSYKAKPLSFRAPASYPNATEVAGVMVAAQAFDDSREAKEAFGFDIRGAGMLPVQVVFDNQGARFFEINPTQTFLEDDEGNLWPILASEIAYERATKYAQTKETFKKGVYHGFLGAAAGAVIGAAIGIVSGQNVAEAAGKGAAIGAAAGGVLGGAQGYASNAARRRVINDLRQKSLQNKAIDPKSLTFGFIFFPGEARSANQLRIQLKESPIGAIHIIKLNFKRDQND